MKKISIAIAFTTLALSALTVCAQTQSRDDLLKEISAKRAELARLEKAFLSPSEEDLAKYADFLHQSDTGLIRLLPRETFDSGNSPDKQALTIRGGGAFYSFKERTHQYVNSTAIGLEQGQLVTIFAGANYAMLANIGDVPLENVSLESSAAQVLVQHTPAIDEPHARVEQRRYMEGATVDGVSYKSRLPLRLNSTYVLRSVIFDTSDSIVALRVVRIENDDSAVILWKLLKKNPTPYLARN
jgi:hypothetical protein